MRELYHSMPALTCYDNDNEPPAVAPSPTPDPGQEKRLTQTEVNRILADDRRKHQAQIQRVEKTLEEMSASKNLTVQEREQMAQELETLRRETRTKEQQQAHEKKQLEDKLTKQLNDEKKEREAWKQRYCEETTARALTDAAAGNDAFRPDQIVTVLKPHSRLTEIVDEKGKGTGKFKVLVDFPDQDENGQPTTVTHTAESAVRRMKDLPQIHGNLFRSGVVSGIGSGSGPGTPTGGKIDVRKLSQEQYMELRAKNPAALGLRAPKGRR
jgi:predicted RNase H-like nuclease (RuvC/YqgF family)